MNKIDMMIDSNKPTKQVESKGLLAPSAAPKSQQQDSTSAGGVELVAAYVKAIRNARKGIKNGK